ncbi:cytochrome-c oxidase, cbb3-type subunit III [Algiphilus sp. W345]|uniref:Cbb3-type cytochrome c oxidase subunit n=1 Tax=Banduia mediterranea TaxID=3075609 RepID=A0ABU2WMH9_9GAMM|nr:cytochrome-c oxidase, cbb3-type subunit III [Algiphilus sp. W345]MDT0499088.1 cytochrome-c oxidase, cbb3-type subunit III [Algiphilus sp. W345]
MTSTWSLVVAVVVLANIIACLWLLIWTSRRRPDEVAEGAETGHVWDDDLREYNNPLPRWWLNMFVLTIIFGLGYLLFYPGLGNFAGRLGWTSHRQHDERLAEVEARRHAVYAQYDGLGIEQLQDHAGARSMGAKLFSSNCAGCHGDDAHGAIGFPNLSDQDWLYGGSAEQVYTTISQGRRGQMPAFLTALTPEEVSGLVAYVSKLHTGEAPRRPDELIGQKKFAITCAACHSADGSGKLALGAPRLNDDTWLYGGSPDQIRQTILFGQKSEMPAFGELLTDTERRLLAAYVLGLSSDAEGAAAMAHAP